MLVPPLNEQAKIVLLASRELDEIAALESILQAQTKQAAIARQSILHAAFIGRLVPQHPADEPASDLLARLRAAPPPARRPRRRQQPCGACA